MYKWILTLTMLLAILISGSGCSSETAAAIAGIGAGAGHTLLGINRDLEEALIDQNAKLEAALEKSANATTEAEKLAAEAETNAIRAKIESLMMSKAGTELLEEGLSIDWSNPKDIGGLSGSAIALLLYFLKRKTDKKYTAAKQGMEKFRMNNPDRAPALYADVGEARKNNGV